MLFLSLWLPLPLLLLLLMWLSSHLVVVFVHVSHRFTYLLSVIIIYQRSLCRSLCAKPTRRTKGLRSKCNVRYANIVCSFCLSFCVFSTFIYGRALTMCAEVISFNLCNQRGHIIIIIVIYPTFFLFLSPSISSALLLQELWPALTVIRGSGIDHLDFFVVSSSSDKFALEHD